MNITLNIDDETLAQAKAFAKVKGTSVSAVVKQALADFNEQAKREQALASLLTLRGNFSVEKFNRDECYDRQDIS